MAWVVDLAVGSPRTARGGGVSTPLFLLGLFYLSVIIIPVERSNRTKIFHILILMWVCKHLKHCPEDQAALKLIRLGNFLQYTNIKKTRSRRKHHLHSNMTIIIIPLSKMPCIMAIVSYFIL